ncbi:hypothetical protein Bca101_075998 [Brassica carinata]
MDSSARLQYPPLLTQILLHFPTFHWCAKGYMSDYVLVSIGGIEQFLTSSACRQICPHLRWLQRSSSSRSVSTLPTHPLGSNRGHEEDVNVDLTEQKKANDVKVSEVDHGMAPPSHLLDSEIPQKPKSETEAMEKLRYRADRETMMSVADGTIEVNFGDKVMRRQHSEGGCSGGWRLETED